MAACTERRICTCDSKQTTEHWKQKYTWSSSHHSGEADCLKACYALSRLWLCFKRIRVLEDRKEEWMTASEQCMGSLWFGSSSCKCWEPLALKLSTAGNLSGQRQLPLHCGMHFWGHFKRLLIYKSWYQQPWGPLNTNNPWRHGRLLDLSYPDFFDLIC